MQCHTHTHILEFSIQETKTTGYHRVTRRPIHARIKFSLHSTRYILLTSLHTHFLCSTKVLPKNIRFPDPCLPPFGVFFSNTLGHAYKDDEYEESLEGHHDGVDVGQG